MASIQRVRLHSDFYPRGVITSRMRAVSISHMATSPLGYVVARKPHGVSLPATVATRVSVQSCHPKPNPGHTYVEYAADLPRGKRGDRPGRKRFGIDPNLTPMKVGQSWQSGQIGTKIPAKRTKLLVSFRFAILRPSLSVSTAHVRAVLSMRAYALARVCTAHTASCEASTQLARQNDALRYRRPVESLCKLLASS